MDSISAYLPYAVGIARWVIFLSLKAVPAMFYHPYTSKTLQRDVKRHEMLMKRGWYLRFRTGTLSGLGGGLIGLALANLSAWLIDEAAYHRLSAIEKIIQSLIIGFIPGFFVVFSFAVIIESVNIRVRKKFMRSLVIRTYSSTTDATGKVSRTIWTASLSRSYSLPQTSRSLFPSISLLPLSRPTWLPSFRTVRPRSSSSLTLRASARYMTSWIHSTVTMDSSR